MRQIPPPNCASTHTPDCRGERQGRGSEACLGHLSSAGDQNRQKGENPDFSAAEVKGPVIGDLVAVTGAAGNELVLGQISHQTQE